MAEVKRERCECTSAVQTAANGTSTSGSDDDEEEEKENRHGGKKKGRGEKETSFFLTLSMRWNGLDGSNLM